MNSTDKITIGVLSYNNNTECTAYVKSTYDVENTIKILEEALKSLYSMTLNQDNIDIN